MGGSNQSRAKLTDRGRGGGVKLIILVSRVQGHSEQILVLQRGNWPKFECDKIEYVMSSL